MRSILLYRRTLIAGASAFAVSVPAQDLAAQLRVDVGRGVIEPLPIAVLPFSGESPAHRAEGARVAEIVGADLERSGLFTLTREGVQREVETASLPDFGIWRALDVQALVTGSASLRPDGALAVEYRLFDVLSGSQLRGIRFEAEGEQWRRVGHKIADDVYERLTGVRGYFDTRVTFVAESGPATRRIKRIAVMDQDGANSRFLTDGRDLVLTPRFSPDVEEIAYLAYRGRIPRVFTRNLASGQDRLVGDFGGMTFSPRFSPDGEALLLTIMDGGNANIHTFDLRARRPQRLTSGGAIDTSPSFSPDGEQIVFNSDRGGTPQLYVMRRNGSGITRISYGDGRYGEPAWSPTGDLIAFSKLMRGRFHIGVIRPDGSDERLLTRSFLDETPSWSPNGRVIIFGRQDPADDSRHLVSIDVSGYNERRVSTPIDASMPDWSRLLT